MSILFYKMENLTLTSIDRMTVVELRQKLEELKQEIGGSKAVLKLRLMNLLAAENPQNEAETNDDDDNGGDGNDENGEERQSEMIQRHRQSELMLADEEQLEEPFQIMLIGNIFQNKVNIEDGIYKEDLYVFECLLSKPITLYPHFLETTILL